MIRFFYRYARRLLRRRLGDKSYILGDFLRFDFARNLIITSLFTYYAIKTHSFFAYFLLHWCLFFFTVYLFRPVFRFLLRVSEMKSEVRKHRMTLNSTWWFFNIFSLFQGIAFITVMVLATYQVR